MSLSNKNKFLILLLLSGFLLGRCAEPDDEATSSEVVSNKIAVFSPAVLQNMIFLDLDWVLKNVILLDTYSFKALSQNIIEKKIKKGKGFEVAGDFLRPSYEKILSERVVTLFIQGKNPRLRDFCIQNRLEFREIKIETIADIQNSLRELTKVIRTDRAKTNLRQWEEKYEFILKDSQKAPAKISAIGIVAHLGGRLEKVIAGGGNTFVNELLQLSGCKNAAAKYGGWPVISRESLLSLPIDLVFEFDPEKKRRGQELKNQWQQIHKKVTLILLQQENILRPDYQILESILFLRKKLGESRL